MLSKLLNVINFTKTDETIQFSLRKWCMVKRNELDLILVEQNIYDTKRIRHKTWLGAQKEIKQIP